MLEKSSQIDLKFYVTYEEINLVQLKCKKLYDNLFFRSLELILYYIPSMVKYYSADVKKHGAVEKVFNIYKYILYM